MVDLAGLAVHECLGPHHITAKGLTNGLMAEAYAQNGQIIWRTL